MRHELKTWPEFFEAVRQGIKRFELRRNDRNFQVGDELLLKEYNPMVADTHFSHTSNVDEAIKRGYSGQEVLMRVDYILTSKEAVFIGLGWENKSPLQEGYVIMSISLI